MDQRLQDAVYKACLGNFKFGPIINDWKEYIKDKQNFVIENDYYLITPKDISITVAMHRIYWDYYIPAAIEYFKDNSDFKSINYHLLKANELKKAAIVFMGLDEPPLKPFSNCFLCELITRGGCECDKCSLNMIGTVNDNLPDEILNYISNYNELLDKYCSDIPRFPKEILKFSADNSRCLNGTYLLFSLVLNKNDFDGAIEIAKFISQIPVTNTRLLPNSIKKERSKND